MIIEVSGSGPSTSVSTLGTPGVNGTNGTDGVDGLSAYEIAVNDGFVGTESQWLASLGGSAFVVYQYELQAADIIAKGITLIDTPSDNNLVTMNVVGGVPQENGVDFSVAGLNLTWSLLGYEALAEAGDILIITYQK